MRPLNTVSHGHGAPAGSQSDIDDHILKMVKLFNMLDYFKKINHKGRKTDTTLYFQALLSRFRPYKNLVDDFLQENLYDKTQVKTLSNLLKQSLNSDIQKDIYKFLFHKVKEANTNASTSKKISQTEINELKAFLDPSNEFLDDRQTPLSEDYLKILRDLNSLEKVSAAIDMAINLAGDKAVKVLVIKRAWQVTGEYLKSSEESLHLSHKISRTINTLFKKQLKSISTIRDELSHAKTLVFSDDAEYISSLAELTKLNEAIKKLIYREKFKSIISLIANLPNITKSSDDINSALGRDIVEISKGRQSRFTEVEGIIQSYFALNQNEARRNLILDSLNQLHISIIVHGIRETEISGGAVKDDEVRLRKDHELRDPDRRTISVITVNNVNLRIAGSHLKPEDKIYNAIKKIIKNHEDQTKSAGDPQKQMSTIKRSLKTLEAIKTIFDNKKLLMRFFTDKSTGITDVEKEYIERIKNAVDSLPKGEEKKKSKQVLEILEGYHSKVLKKKKGGNPAQYLREQLDKIFDPLGTLLDSERKQYEASTSIDKFYKILSLPDEDTTLLEQFKQLKKTIYIDHFTTQLTVVKEILLGADGNVADYLDKPKKENLILNPQLKEALKFLLLDLNDTFLAIEDLHQLQDEHKEGLEKILSGNDITLKNLRNYLAHGDDIKDLLNRNLQNLIIDNSLQLIDKGQALIDIMQSIKNKETSLTEIINDLIKNVPHKKMKPKYQDVLTRLNSLDSENSVPSQSSQASKNVMEVLKYKIAGSVLFDDQKSFQYLLDQYKEKSSGGSVNSAVDNLIYHNKRTILHLAAELGHEQFIDIILRESQSLHSKADGHGKLPIFSAALSGDFGSFNLLLAYLDKTNLERTDTDLKTVLVYAVEGKNTDIVKALLSEAKTLNPDDEKRRSFIKYECEKFTITAIFASDDPRLNEISSLLSDAGPIDSNGKSTMKLQTPSCSRKRKKRSGGCQLEGGVIRRLDALSEQVQEVHKRIVEVNRKLIQDEMSLQHSIVNDIAEHIANLESSIQTVKGELSRMNSDLQRITQDLSSPSLVTEVSIYLAMQENAELLGRNIEERINSIKSRAESSIYTVSVSLSERADGLKNAIEVQKIVISHAQEVSTIRNALAIPSGAIMSDEQFDRYKQRTEKIVAEILAMGTTPGIRRSIDFQVEKLHQEVINHEVRNVFALWKKTEESLNPEILINYQVEELDGILKSNRKEVDSAKEKYTALLQYLDSTGRSLVEDIQERFEGGMLNINSKLQYFKKFVSIMKNIELFNVKKSAFYASIKSIELKEGSYGPNVVEKFISEARKLIVDYEAAGIDINLRGPMPDLLASHFEPFAKDIERLQEIVSSVADNNFSKSKTLLSFRDYLVDNKIYDNPSEVYDSINKIFLQRIGNASFGAACSSSGSRRKRDTACSADKYVEELRKLSLAEQEKFAQMTQDSTFSGSNSKIKQAEKARNLLLSETMTDAQRSYEMDKLLEDPKVERFLGVSENPKFKQGLMNAAGIMQFMRGVHGTVVSCKSEGLSTNCAFSVGEMVLSFSSQLIENGMLTITPKVVNSAASVAGKVPVIGGRVKFAIQLGGGKYGKFVARGGAGIMTSFFDVAELADSANKLKNCLSKEGGGKPCSKKEIRDSIAGITFASASLFSGVACTALAMPGVGTVVGVILMVSQAVYSGISTVKEYKKKYGTTHNENLDIFFHAAALQPTPKDVQYLAARTDFTNQLAEEAWKHLQDSPNIVAIAMGLGELILKSYITLGRCKRNIGFDLGRAQLGSHAQRSRHPVCNVERMAHYILPSHASIKMNEANAETSKLSRFTPKSPSQNATVLCAPMFSTHGEKNIYNRYVGYENERYEYDEEGNFLPVFVSQPTAIYQCDNALGIANRTRIANDDKDQTILFDLRNVNKGKIIGSGKWKNTYLVHGGRPQIFGGNNTDNTFNLMDDTFSGEVSGGNNSTDILDFSKLKSQRISYNTSDSSVFLYDQKISKAPNFIARLINWFIGRQGKREDIYCDKEIFVNSRGGYSNNEPDVLTGCKKAVISPYTKATGGDGSYVFYIKPNNILEAVGRSEIDVSGNGTLVFPETAVLKDCRITYSTSNNTLSFKIPLGQNKILSNNTLFKMPLKIPLKIPFGQNQTFVLEVKNYLNEDKTPKFHLVDKYGSNIVPIIRKSVSKEDPAEIRSFFLNAEAEKETSIEVWYERISQSHEDYQVLGVIEDKQSKHKRVFGDSETNIIDVSEVVFAQGRNGSDVYLVDGNSGANTVIDNYAEDRELDVLFIQQNSTMSVSVHKFGRNLLLQCLSPTGESVLTELLHRKIEVKNYFKDPSYQHLMISTNEGMLIPFKLEGRVHLVPFYHASNSQNVFFLSEDSTEIVIDAKMEDTEFYRNKGNLILIRDKDGIPLTIIVKDFYFDPSKWQSVKPYFWNKGEFSAFDLSQKAAEAVSYEEKIESDYKEFFKDYEHDGTFSEEIAHNQRSENGTFVTITEDEQRIGVLILKDIPDLAYSGKDLILFNKKVDHTNLTIKNWGDSKDHRISRVEFDLESGQIVINRLDRFDLSKEGVASMQKLLSRASENSRIDKNLGASDIVNNFQCLITTYGLYKRNNTYKCLGFLALEDQINFAKAYCNLQKLDEFTDKVQKDDQFASLLTQFIIKLYNNLLLNGDDREEIARCSNIVLYKEFASNTDPSKSMESIRNITNTMNNEIQVRFSTTTVSPEASTHRHRHHHEHQNATAQQRNRRAAVGRAVDENRKEESIPSSASKPKSWVNAAVNLVTTIVGAAQLIPSFFKPALPSGPAQQKDFQGSDEKRNPGGEFCEQFSVRTCAQNNIAAFSVLLKTVLDRKCPLPQAHETTDEEAEAALACTLKITTEFEQILKCTALNCGISAQKLNFTRAEIQSTIVEQIINGKCSKILETLCSAAEKACPKLKQTDKFLAQCKSQLKEMLSEKEVVEFSAKKQRSHKSSSKAESNDKPVGVDNPDTCLNGICVPLIACSQSFYNKTGKARI